MNIDISNIYTPVVGQIRAKRQLIHQLQKHQETQLFPNTMVNAGKGQGKSLLAECTAKGLFEYDDSGKMMLNEKGKPKKRGFVEINACQVKNLSHFIHTYILPTQGKQITFFIDEASELVRDVSFAFLTILKINHEKKSTFVYEDYKLDFDFRKQTFIFATAEPQMVEEMLVDRLERIDLEDYSLEELGQIMKMGTPNVTYEDGVVNEIATTLRGNARSAAKRSEQILSFLGNKTEFGKTEWDNFKDIYGIYALGLVPTELQILETLAKQDRGISLTALSSFTNQTPEALRRVYEKYLTKLNLLSITQGSGRQITKTGIEYLQKVKSSPKFQVSAFAA